MISPAISFGGGGGLCINLKIKFQINSVLFVMETPCTKYVILILLVASHLLFASETFTTSVTDVKTGHMASLVDHQVVSFGE